MQSDPNLEALDQVAHALGPLLPEFILVGGCAVGLLITDPGRPSVRPTLDVDLLVEVTTKHRYYQVSESLRQLGFKERMDVICRWTKGELIVDVMPTEENVLGFSNRWYGLAARMSQQTTLPSGLQVRHVSPPLFIATKLESFNGRGEGNYQHHDIEDIVIVVDGRPELFEEIQLAPNEVREFIRDEFDTLLASPEFTDVLPWHLRGEAAEQARSVLILDRMRRMAGL